jgi:F-type H+-transporting ATPase subunit b
MIRRILFTLALLACLGLAGRATAQHAEGPEAKAGASHATSHDAAAGHEGHKQYELLPDLGDKQTYYAAVWVLVIFLVLLGILYKTAWKNVLTGLKAREERIRKDIADAEAARTRAEATLKEYNAQLAAAEKRVSEMLAKATAEGEQIAANIRTRAQQEAEDTKERAMRDIDAARDQAVAQIHEQAAVLATSVAEKILRRNLNPDDQRDLVAQSLSQVETIGAGGARGRGNGRGRA